MPRKSCFNVPGVPPHIIQRGNNREPSPERKNRVSKRSRPIDPQTVTAWPMTRRLYNNTIAVLVPLL
ncbi:MAG: hypothetical protein ABF297_05995 [Thiogranum sp.]